MNAANAAIRRIPSNPSKLFSVLVKNLNDKSVTKTEIPIQKGMSNLRFSLQKVIGKNMAVNPRMPNTLKMFEPTILPIATSEFPFNAPRKLTVSSGIDVPIPMIAAPMKKSDTLYLLATETDPATRKSAPNTIPARDMTKMIYSIAT